MELTKAVITAAGPTQRTLPLQTLIDRDGVQKTALQIIVEEVLQAGIKEIAVVVFPGDEQAFQAAAPMYRDRIRFIPQVKPMGYGHAVYCAKDFVDSDMFLLLVGDHLYLSTCDKPCACQLVEIALQEKCAVSGVQATHESKLPYYGAVGGHLFKGRTNLYRVTRVIEKPTPTEAEQHLVVPGLRAGYYLCYFGMHVLPHTIFTYLEEMIKATNPNEKILLTPALAKLAESEQYLALEIRGRRFDIGVKYGLMFAQLAFALEGKDRDEILTGLIEMLALRQKS